MRIDGRHGRAISPAFVLLIVVAMLFWWMLPESAPDYGTASEPRDMRLDSAEIAFSDSAAPPEARWQQHAIPSRKLLEHAPAPGRAEETLWLRFRFDTTPFQGRPIAVFAEAIEQNYAVFLDGHLIYRTTTGPNDRSFSWNGPLLLQLPPALLAGSQHALTMRVSASPPQPLVVEDIQIGMVDRMRNHYDRASFLGLIAPQIITGYLLILTIGACTFWIKRPREALFGWLALVGVVWMFRNLHNFIQHPPFEARQFWMLTTDSVFVLIAAAFGFGIRFFELPHARHLTAVVFASCLAEVALRRLLVSQGFSELPVFMLTLPVTAFYMALFARACLKARTSGRWLIFGALGLAVLFSFHDLARSLDAWSGAGVALQPYGGLLLFSAFDIVLTGRLQNALADVEDVNERLDARVVAVTDELKTSEASRARLQVSMAVGQERDRIMQEIHDGIGSNLVTALAQAQRQGTSNVVTVLSRSITDLKIAVDSLEPVEGDLILLLASLRHRMEADLLAGGITTEWKVEQCPPLSWLNPINALHILRIIQEAIGNVLLHANATTITITCAPQRFREVDGILVSVIDDGAGPVDRGEASRGRGLRNMRARAEALNGSHRFEANETGGSRASLWIPLRP